MRIETWKPVVGYEGLYEVSDLGNVRSLPRRVLCRFGKYRISPGKNMTLFDMKGYRYVNLNNRKIKQFQAHRLVAIAFIPNPENKPCVNHISGVKHDNRIENLEWATHRENELHSYAVLGKKPNKTALGKFNEDHSKSIPIAQMSLDGTLIKVWPSAREVERSLGYNSFCLRACANGKTKTSYGFKWKDADSERKFNNAA